MATGDILDIRINADGWSADVDIENLGLGGIYDFGITGVNSDVIAPTLLIPVTSPGFTDAGAPTTIARSVFATHTIRKPHGLRATGVFTTPTFVDGECIVQDVSGAVGVIQYAKGQADLLTLRVSVISGVPTATDPWRSALAPAWVSGTVYTVSGTTPGLIVSNGGINYQSLGTHTAGVFATDLAAGLWIALPAGTGVFTPSTVPLAYAVAVDEFITTGSPNKITVRVSLSDYIFAGDTVGVATVLAGLLTNGVASNPASMAPTNNSTVGYPRVVGNWSTVNGRRFKVDSLLKVVAYHRSAQQGRSVRCVKFTVTDGTTTKTVIATAPTVDINAGDPMPVTEYIAQFNPADFIDKAVLTCNFAAYPWYGDAGSVLDTTDGGATAQPTGLYGPITSVNSGLGGLSGGICTVVDPVLGNDATGVASAVGSVPLVTVAPAALAHPFLTMAAARNAMRVLNNSANGIDNTSDCFMYLAAGNHAAFGGTISAGATAMTAWLTITALPGVSRDNVVIATRSASGSRSLAIRMKFENVTISASSTSGIIDGAGSNFLVWLKSCVLNVTAQPFFFRGIAAVWVSLNNIVSWSGTGFSAFSATTSLFPMVRGNTGASGGVTNVLIGNKGRISTGERDTVVPANMVNQVIAHNYWTGQLSSSNPFSLALQFAETHGKAFIQNILENTLWNASPPISQFSADNSTNTPVTNILIWHNTWAGQRVNGPYDESAQLREHVRSLYQFLNNSFDETYCKADNFGSTVPFDGRRRGNWPSKYSVGDSGNSFLQIGLFGNFTRDFWGVHCIPYNAPGANVATFQKYVARGSQDYVSGLNGPGNGDYRVLPTSPLINLGTVWVLPFDAYGRSRVAGSQISGAATGKRADAGASLRIGLGLMRRRLQSS